MVPKMLDQQKKRQNYEVIQFWVWKTSMASPKATGLASDLQTQMRFRAVASVAAQ